MIDDELDIPLPEETETEVATEEVPEATPDVATEEGTPTEGETPPEGEPAEGETPPGPEGGDPTDSSKATAAPPVPATKLTDDILKEVVKFKAEGVERESSVADLIESGKDAVRLKSVAEKNLREAASLRGSAKKVVEMISNDPLGTAISLRVSQLKGKVENPFEQARMEVFEQAKTFLLPILNELETLEKLPEPERKVRELQKKLEWRERELREEQERIQRERQQSAQVLEMQRVDEAVAKAIAEVGLPDTPAINDAMLRTMERFFDAGKDLTPVEVARMVKAKIQASRTSKRPPPEEVVEDAEYMEALRKAELAKRQKPPARSSNQQGGEFGAAKAPSNPATRSDGAKPKRISMDDLFSPFH